MTILEVFKALTRNSKYAILRELLLELQIQEATEKTEDLGRYDASKTKHQRTEESSGDGC